MKPLRCTPTVALNIREGRQTQDRRPVKLEGYEGVPVYETSDDVLHDILDLHPFSVGDVLYLREKFCIGKICEEDSSDGHPGRLYVDQCPGDNDFIPYEYCIKHNIGIEDVKWKSSRHMPKKYARTFVTVKRVWVERIQDISEEDAMAQGVELNNYMHSLDDEPYKACFEVLWNPLYGPGAWDRNDWVWATEFELEK